MDTHSAEPTRVGEMLREEYLKPLGITAGELAVRIGISRNSAELLLADERRMNDDEAEKLASLFHVDAGFWLNLRDAHERWTARRQNADRMIGR